LFDGGIIIINDKSSEVLFQNEKIKQHDFDLFNGTVTSQAVFKLMIKKDDKAKKDEVRLYEN
jgi:hypothetical protein